MQLELSAAQSALLRDTLDSTYRDLKYEIARTDDRSFKEELRQREALLLTILDAVGGPLPDVQHR
jgi:hypothetical protein